MKLNELITDFYIATTNEEKSILRRIQRPESLSSFNEREQRVIEGLIKKSLAVSFNDQTLTMVIANEP